MAKSTRYKLTKDDPIFKEGTQAFVPAPRPPSGPRTISRAEINRVDAKMGWKRAEPNDPIYSEGPSITFSSRTPKQSEPRVIDSPLNGSPSDSDSQPPKED